MQLQPRLAECQPGLICKVTDVLGTGKCWRTELVSLGQVCPWSWATLGRPWSISDLLQLWLWLVFKDDCAILHLRQKKSVSSPSWQDKRSFDWLADSMLLDLLHPLQLVLSHLWLFEPHFPLIAVTTPCWVPRCCQPPCPGVSGYPSSFSTRAAPQHLPGCLEL